MRPSVSQGDPAQFIVAGSIGDQRVRILVDTGATISFITSALVPMLRLKPEVKKSELSVVLGNSETQDTDHYVEVPLTIHSCVLPANLHLLQLPNAFDIIVGLDWLALHDSHVHVRARSLEITNSVGKRILVAACGGVMSGLPRREPSVEWGHLATTLCFLQPTTATRKASLRKDRREGYDGDMSKVRRVNSLTRLTAACVGERVRVGRVCDVCTLGGRQRVWVRVCVCDVRACTCVCVGACGSDHLGCLREVGRHGGLGERQQQGTRR